MVAPWVALSFVLLMVAAMHGSPPWSGMGKFALLLGCALLILLYERWFIDATRKAVEGAPEESPYKFSHELLREPNALEVRGALDAWCGSHSLADKANALQQLRTVTDDDEGFKRLTQVVDKLQSRIGEEYADIHSRTGWLVAGQAFLLTAFVTVVNAERMSAGSKQWLTIAIGLAAAGISFVLALSIFYGTALVEALKRPRDDAEKLAASVFKVPKTGVEREKSAHIFSHYATRYIPCLAYIAWVALTLLAIDQAFGQIAPSGMTLMFPPGGTTTDPVGPAASGRGWKMLEPSPPFALGAATFEERVPGCPDPEVTKKKAQEWLNDIVSAWQNRESVSTADVLILVGGADRIRLGDALKHQYDTNMGLARSRAETIKTMLIRETGNKSQEHKLTAKRILVLVTGPQYSPKAGKLTTAQRETCQEFSDDRRVQVWLPAGG